MGTLKKIVGPNLLHASYGFKLWILSGINWALCKVNRTLWWSLRSIFCISGNCRISKQLFLLEYGYHIMRRKTLFPFWSHN